MAIVNVIKDMRNKYDSRLFLIASISIFVLIQKLDAERPLKFKKVTLNTNGTVDIEDEIDQEMKKFKFIIAVTVKNNAYSLPTFLATLETLKCPNEDKKCDLWFIFDKCSDKSYEIFTDWLGKTRLLFDTILMINTNNDQKTKENHPELNQAYFSKNLKTRALAYALDKEFDYVLFLNADNILTNPDTLEILVRKQKPIVAPLLTSSETRHSTYGLSLKSIDDDSNDKYSSIYDRTELGCFRIKRVQETFLLDLKHSKVSQFLDISNQNELDDDLVISNMANNLKISMYVCNRDEYGYIPDSIKDKKEAFTQLRIEHLIKGPNKTYNEPLKLSENIDESLLEKPKRTKLGFDEIYIINLERRADRRRRIESALNDLGVDYKVVKAVDGRVIDEDYLQNFGIKSLPNYKDPYNDRPLNYGEIGCFMSHYLIWKEMIEKNYKKIIIFEDDAKFVLNFREIIKNLMNSINEKRMPWDLLYLGRKIMRIKEETWNYEIPTYEGYGLRELSYSHWTVAYALSLDGAKKLLAPEPLKKMIPVDEYLPIMFDRQPNEYWSSFFPVRNLIAYAIQPSVIYPTHYTGEPSHVSDTEHTQIIDTSKFEGDVLVEDAINDENVLIDLGQARVEL